MKFVTHILYFHNKFFKVGNWNLLRKKAFDNEYNYQSLEFNSTDREILLSARIECVQNFDMSLFIYTANVLVKFDTEP